MRHDWGRAGREAPNLFETIGLAWGMGVFLWSCWQLFVR